MPDNEISKKPKNLKVEYIQKNNITELTCSRTGNTLPLSEFRIHSRGYYLSYCKEWERHKNKLNSQKKKESKKNDTQKISNTEVEVSIKNNVTTNSKKLKNRKVEYIQKNNITELTCTKTGKTLPISHFRLHSRGYYLGYCKEYEKTLNKKYKKTDNVVETKTIKEAVSVGVKELVEKSSIKYERPPISQFEQNVFDSFTYLKPFATRWTGSEYDGEDLLQETSIKALRNEDKFKEGTNIKAWLYTMMRNIHYSNYQKAKNYKSVDIADNSFILENSNTDSNTSKVSLMMEDIKSVMDSIDQKYTTPFMMYFEGYKYEEISEILDIPLGTTKGLIFKARKEAQSLLTKRGIVNSKDKL